MEQNGNLPVKEAEVWSQSTPAIWWQKLERFRQEVFEKCSDFAILGGFNAAVCFSCSGNQTGTYGEIKTPIYLFSVWQWFCEHGLMQPWIWNCFIQRVIILENGYPKEPWYYMCIPLYFPFCQTSCQLMSVHLGKLVDNIWNWWVISIT